jgi:hypothetical protein
MNLFVTVCMSLCVLSVVFNVYGPRAVADDADRIEFKHRFYGVLEVSLSVSECIDEMLRLLMILGLNVF